MTFDWKALLGQVAPALGTALGGPFGALAGVALKTALGLANEPDGQPDEQSDERALENALRRATPEQLLAIRQADNQFQLDMERLGIDLAKIDAEDRGSARAREAAVKDSVPGTLAGLVTLGFFGLLGWLMLASPPAESKDILNLLLGALGAAWTSIVSYYFGSSAGSARLRETLQRLSMGGR